jgi:hypothetical protein
MRNIFTKLGFFLLLSSWCGAQTQVDLMHQVKNTLPIANGGTGNTTGAATDSPKVGGIAITGRTGSHCNFANGGSMADSRNWRHGDRRDIYSSSDCMLGRTKLLSDAFWIGPDLDLFGQWAGLDKFNDGCRSLRGRTYHQWRHK